MAFVRGTSRSDRLDGTDVSDFILASAGDDVVSAGAGNDYVDGGDGNDILLGGDGNDALIGGFGNDILEGSFGNDVLVDSTILATLGLVSPDRISDHDVMIGGDGDDVFVSALGNDGMLGGDGNDIFLITGSGFKIVLASVGDDFVVGALMEANSDTPDNPEEWLHGLEVSRDWMIGEQTWLDGGDGNDVVIGGSAADILIGGLGTDTLTGGPGQDLVVFNTPGDGPDTITDFAPGVDKIVVVASGFGGALATGTLPADQFVAGSDPVPVVSGTGAFLYDTDDGSLAWDADGADATAPVTIAILLGQPALGAADFLIV